MLVDLVELVLRGVASDVPAPTMILIMEPKSLSCLLKLAYGLVQLGTRPMQELHRLFLNLAQHLANILQAVIDS